MIRTGENGSGRLGIIAGGGAMPLAVARAARNSGREVHIVGLEGWAPKSIRHFSHSWASIGEFGRMMKAFRNEGCTQVVIVGASRRPDITRVRFDFGTVASLGALLSASIGGDNTLLTGLIGIIERKGFEVVGVHEVAPHLLARPGVLGQRRPGRNDRRDIDAGLEVVTRLGALDVGQAAVVARKYVIAVEAAEGTDRMLKRCRQLRQWGARGRFRTGVLVKCAKPGQERRVDLPTVGPRTVRSAAAAGLSGIAIGAGEVLIAQREAFIRAADEAGLFVVGVETAAAGAEPAQ